MHTRGTNMYLRANGEDGFVPHTWRTGDIPKPQLSHIKLSSHTHCIRTQHTLTLTLYPLALSVALVQCPPSVPHPSTLASLYKYATRSTHTSASTQKHRLTRRHGVAIALSKYGRNSSRYDSCYSYLIRSAALASSLKFCEVRTVYVHN